MRIAGQLGSPNLVRQNVSPDLLWRKLQVDDYVLDSASQLSDRLIISLVVAAIVVGAFALLRRLSR
jgi:hypothetical protein